MEYQKWANAHCINCKNKCSMSHCLSCDDYWSNFDPIKINDLKPPEMASEKE
ncbi:MAG: hypothetical protein GX660_25595 [Clostridiaceae bacterium]|nr:hypothetical protein [Clostridiaceae bacterium]